MLDQPQAVSEPMTASQAAAAERFQKNDLSWDFVESEIRCLLGEVLTAIDASYPDGQQCKAVKDLIRQQFRRHLDYAFEVTGQKVVRNVTL